MKPILSSLCILALLLLSAPSFAATASNQAPDRAVAAGCGGDLAQLLAAKSAVCSNSKEDLIGSSQPPPLDLAVSTGCCPLGSADACRDLCRQQQPGCKGVIGCTAGECTCTCSC